MTAAAQLGGGHPLPVFGRDANRVFHGFGNHFLIGAVNLVSGSYLEVTGEGFGRSQAVLGNVMADRTRHTVTSQTAVFGVFLVLTAWPCAGHGAGKVLLVAVSLGTLLLVVLLLSSSDGWVGWLVCCLFSQRNLCL